MIKNGKNTVKLKSKYRNPCGLSTSIFQIEATSKNDLILETEFALRKKKLGSVMPKEEDLHGAARALIR